MRRVFLIPLAFASIALAPFSSAIAGSTGMESIHTLGREGGRLCMSDHFHYGSGSGDNRKLAEKDAIHAWASFVNMEYGSDWSNFGRAGSRDVNCSDDIGSWSCNVSARPCRGGGVVTTIHTVGKKVYKKRSAKKRNTKRRYRRRS